MNVINVVQMNFHHYRENDSVNGVQMVAYPQHHVPPAPHDDNKYVQPAQNQLKIQIQQKIITHSIVLLVVRAHSPVSSKHQSVNNALLDGTRLTGVLSPVQHVLLARTMISQVPHSVATVQLASFHLMVVVNAMLVNSVHTVLLKVVTHV
jgi:hypothetical protein